MSLALRNALRRARAPPRARGMATAAPPLPDKPFHLPDGRILGVREVGAEKGLPLLFFPDISETRRSADPLGPAAEKHNIRLITLERPGLGSSTPQPGRSHLDWAADVRHFAEARGLARFGVLGAYAGATYALACARALPPGMLSAVGLCSPHVPWYVSDVSDGDRAVTRFCHRWPGSIAGPYVFLTRAVSYVMARAPPEVVAKAIRSMATTFGPSHLGEEKRAAAMRHDIETQLAEGAVLATEGGMQELRLWLADWGFRLEDVAFGPVRIWHGPSGESEASIASMREMAELLPLATLNEYDDTVGLVMSRHRDRIFAELAWMMGSRPPLRARSAASSPLTPGRKK